MNWDTQKEPLISVIVPVYKVERYLAECVESIREQDYPNLEIILVDDGSPDNCPGICDAYAAMDSRIKTIHKKNGGLSSARNVGLDAARGEYIAFVDSDDWIAPHSYSRMMGLMRECQAEIVCCEISRFGPEGETERFRFYDTGTVLSGDEVTRQILLDRIGSQVVKGLYKKDCWQGVRFPEGMLYEDIYVTFRAFHRAKKVGFLAQPCYQYRENQQGISLTPNPMTPWYLFLGFQEHYDYAAACFPDIAEECLANAAMYAISTCFHFYCERTGALREPCREAEGFLKAHKQKIRAYPGLMKTRKLALDVFYFSKTLFGLACRIFHVSGLQKKLHFDMK